MSSEPPSASTKSSLLSEQKYGTTTVVPSLSARKTLMCTLTSEGGPGSGFVVLSGGAGTMDEFWEMFTLHQKGVHRCRICLYNVDGFWNPTLAQLESAIQEGFTWEEIRGT